MADLWVIFSRFLPQICSLGKSWLAQKFRATMVLECRPFLPASAHKVLEIKLWEGKRCKSVAVPPLWVGTKRPGALPLFFIKGEGRAFLENPQARRPALCAAWKWRRRSAFFSGAGFLPVNNYKGNQVNRVQSPGSLRAWGFFIPNDSWKILPLGI